MKQILLTLTTFLLFSNLTFAQKVNMKVTLSPMGGFVIEGASVTGQAIEQADGSIVSRNIVLDLRNLKSGIELRDKHIQDYFETTKFPTAVLTKAIARDNKFSGELKIRNITKKIEGTYEKEGNNGKAVFTVKMSDFQIKKAIYMGVGAEDEIEVTVEGPISKGESKTTPSTTTSKLKKVK